jgi:hypothetical protein
MTGKEPLIPPDWEDYWRDEFTWHWNEGHPAKEIFEDMQFDDPANTPWKPLKLWHVYYFAEKYGLKKRKGKRHRATQEET